MAGSKQLLSEILSLTQQLYRHAGDAQWDTLDALELQRRKLLELCFPLDDTIDDPDQAAHVIRLIMELDQQVIALARTAQQEVGEQLGRLRQGREATQTYQSIES